MSYSRIFEEPEETQIKPIKRKIKKYKKRKSHFFAYLYLFLAIFLLVLWGISNFIKSYSPKVNLDIDNTKGFTLSDSDVGVEIKTIDERLKWIQMEDELPSVSVKIAEKHNKDKAEKIEKAEKTDKEKSVKNSKPPVPTLREIKNKQDEFKNIPTKEIVALPKHTVTKVYFGNFSTLEEAVIMQNKIKTIEPDSAPFVKSVKGHYIVQVGSFSDGEKAGALAEKLRAKGYYPKTAYEH